MSINIQGINTSITAAGKPLSIDRNKFVEHQMESVCDKKQKIERNFLMKTGLPNAVLRG